MPSSAARASAPRATSAKNGLPTSSTTRPMLRLRPARSWRAASLRTKPRSSIACITRSTVAGDTFDGRLSTFETVPTETDAATATSRTLTATARSPSRAIISLVPIGAADSSASRSATARCSSGPVCWKIASPRSRPGIHCVVVRNACAAAGLPASSTSRMTPYASGSSMTAARLESSPTCAGGDGRGRGIHLPLVRTRADLVRARRPGSSTIAVVFGGIDGLDADAARRSRVQAARARAVGREVLGRCEVEALERMRRDPDPLIARAHRARDRRRPGAASRRSRRTRSG